MAIFFHEGQPRSGKSYEAAAHIILPAIKSKRKVYAYVEGLNHKKFAELSGLKVSEVEELLIQLDEDDIPDIGTKCYDENWKDCWIIIDELQDFFPSGKNKLSPENTK